VEGDDIFVGEGTVGGPRTAWEVCAIGDKGDEPGWFELCADGFLVFDTYEE
jgi:hypothetical protein